MSKLYSTAKIDLVSIFKSPDHVNAKVLIKKKGKQYYGIKSVPLNSLSNYLSACQYIIHRIIESQKLTNTHWLVNLPSKSIDKAIGSRKRTTSIHLLFELGIIEINNSYNCSAALKNKRFSKSYRISDEYLGEVIEIEGDIHPTQLEKGRVTYITNDFNKPKTGDIHTTELHFKEKTGDIHPPLVHSKVMSNTYPSVCHPLFISYQLNNLNRINTGDSILPKISAGIKTGKVFTFVNRMKKDERSLLTDSKGNPLIEVDLKTSHLQQLIKVIRDDLKSGAYIPQFSIEYFCEEMKGFKEEVLMGDFYNNLCIKYMRKFNKQINRDQAKLYVMYWLNNTYANWNGVKLLNELYPQLSHYVRTVNGTTKNTLSIRLQSSEAYMVNNLIINRLATEHPDSMCFTIFDGFLIEKKYLSQLETIIKEESKNYLLFDAQVKIKNAPSQEEKELPINELDMMNMPTTIDKETLTMYSLLL